MASACVNNIGVTPDNFLNMGWLSPRMSFGRESKIPDSLKPDLGSSVKDSAGDFEFCLRDDSVTMLPADELFSDGKLVPLHFPKAVSKPVAVEDDVSSPEKEKSSRKSCDGLSGGGDQYLFSPKAPRCSSRWRELLGLKNKKLPQYTTAAATAKAPPSLTTSTSSSSSSGSNSNSSTSKSIRHFLHRNSRMSTSSSSSSSSSSSDPLLSLPLLHRSSDSSSDCCGETSFSISSSRLSLSSSSSSGHEHDDFPLPRLSLDDKPRDTFRSSSRPRVRLVRPRMVPVENPNQKPLIDHPSAAPVAGRIGRSPMRRANQQEPPQSRGVSVDSPRMNPSGKIVFQSLERSSSSPSTFNGGPRYKYRGMERSYSANVRVTPVLNVPVCSLRGSSKSGGFGFGQLFSSSSSSSSQSQRREKENSSSNNNGGIGGSSRNHHHQHHHHNHRRKESS